MVNNILGNIYKINDKAKDKNFIKMETNMMESGLMIKEKDSVSMFGLIKIIILVYGKMIK